MNRQEHLTGRLSVVNDDALAAMSSTPAKSFPFGLPRRIHDALEKICHDLLDPLIDAAHIHDLTHLTPSDVPGVLVAAGIDEVFASLGRIEKAKGFCAAEAAYHAILKRALADGRDDIAQQMTQAREAIVRARREQVAQARDKPQSTKVRDLMQQKADEAQREAKAARMTEREENEAKRQAFEARREQEAEREYLRRANMADYQKSSLQTQLAAYITTDHRRFGRG
jgi:predicted RNA-binding protein